MRPSDIRSTDVEREKVPLAEVLIMLLVVSTLAWVIADAIVGAYVIWRFEQQQIIRAEVLRERVSLNCTQGGKP